MQPLGVDEPTVVGPYRLLGRLGSGGMGRVYLGRSAGGRTVAVKIVHPHYALDEEFRARFRREVAAARRVGGAWTAPVLDADPEAAVPWVATAYAAGPSLAAAVADGGPLPAHSVRVLGAGLAEALAAVHELGLVHRDVKPSNVLLTLDGPLLIDFGIARATDGTASLTSTGVSIGSPGYMSPEQILGRTATGAADVFSLGAVLAYAATGEPPFRGDTSAALLYKVVHEEPELDALEGDLRDLAAACLAKEPGARPDPGEVARRLAPQGTARLVAGGWLPGHLVEQVSRSAVQLLNLEATGANPAPASGPVEFSRWSVPDAGADPAGAEAAGEFGPPPAMSKPGEMPASTVPPAVSDIPGASSLQASPPPRTAAAAPPATAAASTTAPAAPRTDSTAAPTAPGGPPLAIPEPRDATPDVAAPASHAVGAGGEEQRPGRFSVTVSAGSVPGADGRGRRLSCSVALAVAGALAAVTVGSVFVFRMLPGDGDSDTSAGGSDTGGYTSAPSASTGASGSPSASNEPGPAPSASASEAGPSAVPEVYIGTWRGEGTVTALGQDLPGGTYDIVIRRAAVGGVVGSVTQTDALGGACVDVLTLKSATAKELVAVGRGSKDNPSHCVPDAHVVRLRPDGDALRFTSVDPKAGNPKARVERVD